MAPPWRICRARARTDQLLLSGLRRWGYVSVTSPDGRPLRNPPQDEAVVRPRKGSPPGLGGLAIAPRTRR